MIKKITRFFIYLLLGIIAIIALTYVILDKPLPSGALGQEAEELADEMLAAINKTGFDSLEFIEFTFRNTNRHQWDIANNQITVTWEDQQIWLDLNRSMDSYNMLEFKAYEKFINDSFWLIAPFKVRDPGVIRSTVPVEDGRGLLITYSSGGLTPGDSYLWIIDDRGFPKAWKLWTSNVPIGGLEFSWSGWQQFEGTWLASVHEGKITSIPIEIHSVR